MRNYLFAAFALLFLHLPASAQTAHWTGKLEISGQELMLVFHIGGENPTMDVPAQAAKDIPIKVSQDALGGLTIEIPAINAVFKGLSLGTSISGTFAQNGMSFPLMLQPGAPELRRPQTPVAPFPYQTEEVSFANGEAVLRGTLTLPEGCDRKTPVLIMVTGSGLQNRDSELFEHKPFAVIADAFARAGIATLRYDDRGFAESTGDVSNCTTEDFKKDALAGVGLLRERFDRVGVLGHSEGGTIALLLAAEGQVDFALSLAGMVISGAQTIVEQNRHSLSRAGVPSSETEEFCRLLTAAFDAIIADEPLPSAEDYELSPALKQTYTSSANTLRTPYLREFYAMDVSKRLDSVSCPVMALNGTKDTQVDFEKNLSALRAALPANEANLVRAEEGLNHIFQHCGTGEVTEYEKIEETFSPEVISEMIVWIKGL